VLMRLFKTPFYTHRRSAPCGLESLI